MKERADESDACDEQASPSSAPQLPCASSVGCGNRTVVEGSSVHVSSGLGDMAVEGLTLEQFVVDRSALAMAEAALPPAAFGVDLALSGDGAREVGTEAGGDGARDAAADVGGDGTRETGTDDGCEVTREQAVDAAVECTQDTEVDDAQEPLTSIRTRNRTQPSQSSTPSRVSPQASL